MTRDRITVGLSPVNAGAYTLVRAEGVVPTTVPGRELLRLARGLSFWNGYPVQCALYVDLGDLGWCGWWLDQLAHIPDRHLEVRYVHGTAAGDDR